MKRLFQKPDPEAPDALARLTPRRTYTAEEVHHLMSAMVGLVNDGLPMTDYMVREKERWYEVEVIYLDTTQPDETIYETWYFFKGGRDGTNTTSWSVPI